MLRLIFAALAFFVPVQEKAPDLAIVLERAADYVKNYEEALGNLIATEEYVQNAQWRNLNSRFTTVAQKQQRRTSSDFLILQVGSEWEGLRKVNRLDGVKLKAKEPSFEDAFDDSPKTNSKRLKDMIEESTRYNIGDVLRQMNLPTFALKILRPEHSRRFAFHKVGTDKTDGVQTWVVRFKETTGPTLVAGDEKGQFLFSYGTLWIEPNTGRILRTEFEVENPYTKPAIRARIVVSYAMGKKIDMLVPNMMMEHYETDLSHIDCRADYANFRRFEVEVKFDLGTPEP